MLGRGSEDSVVEAVSASGRLLWTRIAGGQGTLLGVAFSKVPLEPRKLWSEPQAPSGCCRGAERGRRRPEVGYFHKQ